MNRTLGKLLAAVAALGLLAALNPSEARHRERFGEAFRTDHPVLSLFGADRVAPSLLTYRSYGIVSVGRVGERVATVGGVGIVRVRERTWKSSARRPAPRESRASGNSSTACGRG